MAINKINRLRFYAQKILPLSYDNSLTYLEWLEKVVATCNEVVTTINSVIDVVEDVESDVAEIRTQVTGILASISGIQTHLTNIDANIGSLNGRVSNVETAISSIQSSITSIQGEVATLRGRVNSLSSELDTLSGTVAYNGRRISTLETSVSDMSDNISTIESDISNIESSLSSISSRLSTAETDISTLETTVSAHGSQIQILHDTDTTFSNLFGKNARYDNDVINRYSKNLIDVETYANDKIEADPTWETRTENGISVLYLGAGVYKVWGTSTARTIFPLYETLDITEMGGLDFNGVPSDADARVFMSVRQYGVSDYDTYYGTANTPSAMGVLPETVSGSVYMALQIGQYVYMGDGVDEYVEIKPMVINPNFPSSRLTDEYKEFAPYTRPLNEISDLAVASFYNTQSLSADVEDLQTDVATLQNEPKLPAVSASDNNKILRVYNGSWRAQSNTIRTIYCSTTSDPGVATPSSPYSCSITGDSWGVTGATEIGSAISNSILSNIPLELVLYSSNNALYKLTFRFASSSTTYFKFVATYFANSTTPMIAWIDVNTSNGSCYLYCMNL